MVRWLGVAIAATALGCAGAGRAHPGDPMPFDEDDPRATADAPAPDAPAPAPAEPAAPAVPDIPATVAGAIERPVLHAVLDAGPGRFLAGIEVEPVFRDRRFAGWQIVRFEPADARIARAPLAPGDIVIAVNARRIERPQQLQVVWDALRTAEELVIAGERGGEPFLLRYAIRAPQP